MFVGILNPALHYILWGPAKAQPVYSTGCILEKIGDTGGDKSLSASPWVSNHTRGHQQSVFEALPLHFQGPTLRPHYKSAYTHTHTFLAPGYALAFGIRFRNGIISLFTFKYLFTYSIR